MGHTCQMQFTYIIFNGRNHELNWTEISPAQHHLFTYYFHSKSLFVDTTKLADAGCWLSVLDAGVLYNREKKQNSF